MGKPVDQSFSSTQAEAVTCPNPVCGKTRTFYFSTAKTGEEHIWCIHCQVTYKVNRGTRIASKFEDIKLKQEK
jgi:hypothetical protein